MSNIVRQYKDKIRYRNAHNKIRRGSRPGAVLFTRYNWVWSLQNSGTTENLRCFWKNNNGNLRVVGDNGTVLELVNYVWTPVETGISLNLVDIWGISAYPLNKYVIASNPGTVLCYDGSDWVKTVASKWNLFFGK